MKPLLILALATSAAAADLGGMERDYTAALERRAELDRELDRRLALFNKEIAGLEKSLDRDATGAAKQCAKANQQRLELEAAAKEIETIRADINQRLLKIPKGACSGYDLRRTEALLAASTGPAAEIAPLLSRAKSLARTRLRVRADAQEIAAPWDQRPGRLALASDQAESLRILFEEARQRLDAARVTRREMERLSGKKTTAPHPDDGIDYAARERGVIDAPFSRLQEKIDAMRCAAQNAPTVRILDASADAALAAFSSLSANTRRCRADAAAALKEELSNAVRVAKSVHAEELAYEQERKKHLSRDLEEWKRRRKRESRRLAQQRRFAKTMRPPRRRKDVKGTGRKGPWLTWGSQTDADAPIRLRVTDVDGFEEDPAPYKRVLRSRAFRSLSAAQTWICQRLAGVRERPVIGRSAEFGEEVVSLGDEIRCD